MHHPLRINRKKAAIYAEPHPPPPRMRLPLLARCKFLLHPERDWLARSVARALALVDPLPDSYFGGGGGGGNISHCLRTAAAVEQRRLRQRRRRLRLLDHQCDYVAVG